MHLKIKLLSLFLLIVSVGSIFAQNGLSKQIVNIQNRQTTSLDGLWRTIVDPFENGYYDYRLQPLKSGYFMDRKYDDRTILQEYDFSEDKTLFVPGDWNTQRPELYYYEGTVWYRQHFDWKDENNHRQFLYFGAVNYEAKVYLNGKLIGEHVGGFTPFNIEVTGQLKATENSLVVKVDNKRKPEAVPTVNADWWNFGGITREVQLVSVPTTFIQDYMLQLDKNHNNQLITGWVQLDGNNFSGNVNIRIDELKINKNIAVDKSGKASIQIPVKKLTLWDPDNPKLYDVKISTSSDQISDQIGFRTIETKGTDILLNGKKIFCRGISIHEETLYYSGRAYSEDQAVALLSWAKELGCNFVRLAHYPHNEHMIRVAEKMGLMVWSEIPVYWTIQWDNPDTYANAESQLTDMITRDKNRANVIIWSVANETPLSNSRLTFLSKLIKKTRELDNTRLVAAAMEKEYHGAFDVTVNDPLGELIDLISFNQYIGWYDGNWEKCDKVNWSFNIKKPVFISEFGGDAQYGNHGKETDLFTEEYQEKLYERTIEMLKRIDGLAGTTPWILKDFRSPRRHLPGIQDDFNRKGLISDKAQPKKAFFVLRDWYKEIQESER